MNVNEIVTAYNSGDMSQEYLNNIGRSIFSAMGNPQPGWIYTYGSPVMCITRQTRVAAARAAIAIDECRMYMDKNRLIWSQLAERQHWLEHEVTRSLAQ